MKIVLSHPTGNANVREATKGLLNAAQLQSFYTTVGCTRGDMLYAFSQVELFKVLRRRCYEHTLKSCIKTHPTREMCRLIAVKMGINKLVGLEKSLFSIDAINKNLDDYVANRLILEKRKGANAFFGYEDCSELSFMTAKQLGMTCFYELPIGYWRSMRRFLQREQELHPEWASTISTFKDSNEKLSRKDKELRLADTIFVASSFTAATLKEFPGPLSAIKVIPYGFPPVSLDRAYNVSPNRRLKILFVGGLSQRKGIANLFEAVEFVKNQVELTIVGSKPKASCSQLNSALEKHRWIPSLSNQEILKLMRFHDVLLFPSLFEGFGLVITEAMSQGLPVITTERTCGPDFITNGENGWIVEAGNTGSIIEKLEAILSDRKIVEVLGRAAMKTASLRPWAVYGKELAAALEEQYSTVNKV